MATKVPTIQVRFRAAPRAVEAPERVLLLAPIGEGGDASPAQVYKIVSADDARALFGDSELIDAVAAWFSAGLQREYELHALGVDATGWTANSWRLDITGQAEESAALTVRFGEHTAIASVRKGDDAPAIAAAVQAALASSRAPADATASGTAVDIASRCRGAHTQRFPLSVDLYRDRGELGVPGVTVALSNLGTGAGEPAVDLTALAGGDHDFVLHAFRGTAVLDALEQHLQDGWDKRNAFAHGIVALAGGQAEVAALGELRNDRHASYVAIGDAPLFELTACVRAFEGIAAQLREQGTPNISGQRVALAIPPFTIPLDPETLLDAGITPLRAVRTTVYAVRFVASYRENEDGSPGTEDLSQFDIGTILSLRELGRRLVALFATHLGKALVASGTPLTSDVARFALSPEQLLGDLRELLKELWRIAVVFAASEDDVARAITAVTVITEDDIATGFDIALDPVLVRRITVLRAMVRYL